MKGLPGAVRQAFLWSAGSTWERDAQSVRGTDEHRAAERLEAQADEPFGESEWSMRKADMLLTAEAGLLPDFTGGRDAFAEMRKHVAKINDAEAQVAWEATEHRHEAQAKGPNQ